MGEELPQFKGYPWAVELRYQRQGVIYFGLIDFNEIVRVGKVDVLWLAAEYQAEDDHGQAEVVVLESVLGVSTLVVEVVEQLG